MKTAVFRLFAIAATSVLAASNIFASDGTVTNAVAEPLPLAVKLPPAPPKPKPVVHRTDEVIVRVNGCDITWGAVNRYADMMATLLKNKSPKISDAKLKQFKTKNLKRFSDDLYYKTIMTTCLAQSNIVVSAETRKDIEEGFVKNYGKRKQSFEELREELKKEGFSDDLDAVLDKEALIRSFLTGVCSNEYYVSDEKVKAVKEDVAAYNRRAEATNECNRALAQRIYTELNDDPAKFAEYADRYSQDPEKKPGGMIGECEETDFTDEMNVWREISALPEGGISKVIETNDGYAIFKVMKYLDGNESNSGDNALELARIFFRRAYQFEEQSDEEFRADVESELREKLYRDLLKKFREISTIERPNGNFEVN